MASFKVIINLQRKSFQQRHIELFTQTFLNLQWPFIVCVPHPLRESHGEFVKVEVFPLAHHHREGERICDEGEVLPCKLACKDVSILLLSCLQEAQWVFTIIQNYTKKRPTFHQWRFFHSSANRHTFLNLKGQEIKTFNFQNIY